MSACGMQYSDIVFEQTRSRVTMSGSFDLDGVNTALAEIDAALEHFRNNLHGAERAAVRKEYLVEARYKSQVWGLDTLLPVQRFRTHKDVAALVEAFHTVHDRVYAVRDEQSEAEMRQLARPHLDPAVKAGKTGAQEDFAAQAETLDPSRRLFRSGGFAQDAGIPWRRA